MELQDLLYSQGFGTRRVCVGLVQKGWVRLQTDGQWHTCEDAWFEAPAAEAKAAAEAAAKEAEEKAPKGVEQGLPHLASLEEGEGLVAQGGEGGEPP